MHSQSPQLLITDYLNHRRAHGSSEAPAYYILQVFVMIMVSVFTSILQLIQDE